MGAYFAAELGVEGAVGDGVAGAGEGREGG